MLEMTDIDRKIVLELIISEESYGFIAQKDIFHMHRASTWHFWAFSTMLKV